MSSGSDRNQISRRELLKFGGISATGVAAAAVGTSAWVRYRQPKTRVAIYRAKTYREPLVQTIKEGLANYPEVIRRAKAGTVVLKPNLVEYYDAWRVNTHPAVVAAAISAFRAVGAKDVVVAEGPGHCRDTELLLEQSDLEHAISSESSSFVDLNLDGIQPLALSANYTKLDNIYFPETLLGASLIVSMPKLKTHHWAGVTLSLKNMFGAVPGARYGWPKNILHWRGIENSIADINVALKPHFAIIDGIEAMEGDGPLRGETVNAGVLIMGDNLTAVDSTGARVMGLYPEQINYLRMMLQHGGTVHSGRIEQIGERIVDVRREFRVVDEFKHLTTPPLFSLG